MTLLFHGFSLTSPPSTAEGEGFELQSLQPKYEPVDHAAYVDMLETALEAESPNAARNIALTGNYGSGKSSIISELESRLGSRSVNIALATMQENLPPENPNAVNEGTGQPSPVTNSIQKEIVKQLLYREKPSRMRGSRYRRIEPFRWWPSIGISAGLALAIAFILTVTGVGDRITQRIPSDIFWVQSIVLATLTTILGGVLLTILWTVHGKLRVDKFTAGAASFSLADSDNYYFDIFLDEIIFFFQRTRCDVAVFEDIDRFEDPHIFETLRELNTILNSAKQLDQRPIRFVYAIKDSIFEMLGRPLADGEQTREWSETAANRTKFFDLVVPIVPFITHRTSRDLVTEQMRNSPKGPSTGVIAAVAPHLTDMRLIKNIRNEYEVFRRVVLSTTDGLEGLKADSLFAMVIYKNVHLTDFELIKSGDSNLDHLYRASRLLVKENMGRLDRETRTLAARRKKLENATETGKTYATRLFQRLGTTNSIFSGSWDQLIRVNGEDYQLSAATNTKFWSAFLVHGGDVLTIDRWGNRMRSTLTVDFVEQLLGVKLKPEDWRTDEVAELEKQIASYEQEKVFLKKADISDLLKRTDLLVSKDNPTSLLKYARSLDFSDLALDLLETRHINENYALYVSKFHGINVSMPAMNFILKVVQPALPDPYFQLNRAQDVQGVLDETGGTLFTQETIYNISIFDDLLRNEDARLTQTIANLSRASETDLDFLAIYVKEGKYPEKLLGGLAARWPGVFVFLAEFDEIPAEQMAKIIDYTLLGSNHAVTYEFNDHVRQLILEHASELSAFTGQISKADAENVARFLQRFDIRIPQLALVTSAIRQHLVSGHLYELTRSNLSSALNGESVLALDVIKNRNPSVYKYVLSDLTTYLSEIDEATPTIKDASSFAAVLNDVSESAASELKLLIQRAHSECVLEDLKAVPPTVWPYLAADIRMAATFKNVETYLGDEDEGDFDAEIAHFLNNQPVLQDTPDGADARSKRMALQFINSEMLQTSTAISLVKSLQLKFQPFLSKIRPRDSDIFGRLLTLGLLPDTSDLFVHIAEQTWDTKEKVITASKKFPSYMLDVELSNTDIQNIATSSEVSNKTKNALISLLPKYPDFADRKALQDLANHALNTKIPVPLASLEVMVSGHISYDSAIQLLQPLLASIVRDDLVKILRLLGVPYDELTYLGGRQPLLPDTPPVKALLTVLKEMKLVSSFPFDQKAKKLRVYKKRKDES